jgi:hypothetical protein
MTKPDRDVNGIAGTEADHHMQCPACGQWFDMRDLAQVMAHIHDQEIEERQGRPATDLQWCSAHGEALRATPNVSGIISSPHRYLGDKYSLGRVCNTYISKRRNKGLVHSKWILSWPDDDPIN